MARSNDSADAWAHVLRVTRPALMLAPTTFLEDTRANLTKDGVVDAVARHDSSVIFDWLQRLFAMQGISDHAAHVFAERHGRPRWTDIHAAMTAAPSCPRLTSHWHFPGCGYGKASGGCSHSEHIDRCPLPVLPLRKGTLNQAAYGLYLFIRDVADGDLVRWIDERLRKARDAASGSATDAALREAVLEPLTTIAGTGRKLWSMALADLLLVGRPGRCPVAAGRGCDAGGR